MPFEDYIIEFLIKGEDLITEFTGSFDNQISDGLKIENGNYYILDEGYFRLLEPNKLYSGLMLDYGYYLNYNGRFEMNETHVHYRDPVISYFKTLNSLQDHLVPFIDFTSGTTETVSSTVSSSVEISTTIQQGSTTTESYSNTIPTTETMTTISTPLNTNLNLLIIISALGIMILNRISRKKF